jgi:TolB-like protein/Tfp pilus assembly protein PilF
VENTEQITATTEQHLTKTGSTIGTIAYMSPEQARGKELDQRTDLFSFGVVLYEMVTGTLPFSGSSTVDVLEGILTRQSVSPVRLNPNTPAELERILQKSMEKDRDLRYQHASDIRSDLQRLKRDSSSSKQPAISPNVTEVLSPTENDDIRRRKMRWPVYIGIAIALIAFGFGIQLLFKANQLEKPSQLTTSKELPAKISPSIAVLPFVNLSKDQGNEYFSDGLAEEILNVLAQIPELRVTARSSSFQFKGMHEDLNRIAQKLNVSNILEGSVRKEGNQVRISAQLINAADGYHLWSQSYDRELNNIFAVQEDIARSVAEALKVKLLQTEASSSRTTNSEAYNAYLRGRFFYEYRTKEGREKAVKYYQEAVNLDPNYALAWSGLAEAQAYQAGNGYVPQDVGFEKAKESVEKALHLNPNLAEAYSTLGLICMWYDWDWKRAEESFQRAIDLNQRSAVVLRAASLFYLYFGPLETSIQLNKQALELDPLSATTYHSLGRAYYSSGRYAEAEVAFKKALELVPQHTAARNYLGRVYLAGNRLQESLTEMEKISEADFRLQGLAIIYHAIGKEKEAHAALDEALRRYEENFAFQIAEIYAQMGRKDAAFEWLNRAYKEHDTGLPQIKFDPLFKPIAQEPEFHAFLKKMKLE